jgi:hypothetical protein
MIREIACLKEQMVNALIAEGICDEKEHERILALPPGRMYDEIIHLRGTSCAPLPATKHHVYARTQSTVRRLHKTTNGQLFSADTWRLLLKQEGVVEEVEIARIQSLPPHQGLADVLRYRLRNVYKDLARDPAPVLATPLTSSVAYAYVAAESLCATVPSVPADYRA